MTSQIWFVIEKCLRYKLYEKTPHGIFSNRSSSEKIWMKKCPINIFACKKIYEEFIQTIFLWGTFSSKFFRRHFNLQKIRVSLFLSPSHMCVDFDMLFNFLTLFFIAINSLSSHLGWLLRFKDLFITFSDITELTTA